MQEGFACVRGKEGRVLIVRRAACTAACTAQPFDVDSAYDGVCVTIVSVATQDFVLSRIIAHQFAAYMI